MSILVTGSVAMDHIMVFEDRFKNHILPDKVHMLNVSFLVPSLERLWGGTGANIAYNLRILGQDPVLLATVGQDFDDYARHLDAQGIRRDWLKVLPDAYTAQAYVTTDLDDNQIWALIVFMLWHRDYVGSDRALRDTPVGGGGGLPASAAAKAAH